MTIKNYTPHPVNICNDAGEVIKVFQPEGLVRLTAVTEFYGEIDGIPITNTKFGKPEGLPEYQNGVYYIVSQIVKSSLSYRYDLLVPAELIRDEKGNVIGCKSLGK